MKDNYKNFTELAKYSEFRAQKSVKRNDPIAFYYWYTVKNWSIDESKKRIMTSKRIREIYDMILKDHKESVRYGYLTVAIDLYWKLKHIRQMMINRGLKVDRLSLEWLRKMSGH